jgi:hypothetical protein
VSEEALDQRLERLFQEALGLSKEQEDAFWLKFADRRANEREVWSAFGSVMMQAAAQLQRAIEWSSWPARGLPGIG